MEEVFANLELFAMVNSATMKADVSLAQPEFVGASDNENGVVARSESIGMVATSTQSTFEARSHDNESGYDLTSIIIFNILDETLYVLVHDIRLVFTLNDKHILRAI